MDKKKLVSGIFSCLVTMGSFGIFQNFAYSSDVTGTSPECMIQIEFGLFDKRTNEISPVLAVDSKVLPMHADNCKSSGGVGTILLPIIENSWNSVELVNQSNYIAKNNDLKYILGTSGRVRVKILKKVNQTSPVLINTLNVFCWGSKCQYESSTVRPTCGLFRGGVDPQKNIIASPNPASSVANTDAACIEYCTMASSPLPGDLCLRYPIIIKKY